MNNAKNLIDKRVVHIYNTLKQIDKNLMISPMTHDDLSYDTLKKN